MKKIIFVSLLFIFLIVFSLQSYNASNFKITYYYKILGNDQTLSAVNFSNDDEGNLLILYNSNNGAAIISKIDNNGQIQDTFSIISTSQINSRIKAYYIVKDGDYNLILASLSTLCDCANYGLLLKFKDRDIIWAKSFFVGLDVIVKKVVVDYDGNYLVLASTKISQDGYDLLVMKFDANGNLLWYKIYGSQGNEYAEDIIASFGNEYLVIGREEGSNKGLIILSIDKDGNLKWSKLINIDISEGIATSFNVESKYVIFGNRENTVFIITIDRNGSINYSKSYDENLKIRVFSVTKNNEGGFNVVGSVQIMGVEKAIFLEFDENLSQIASYVLDEQNTRFKASSQAMNSNIIFGEKDGNKLILFKASLDLTFPSSDMFLPISFPLKDFVLNSADLGLNISNQDIYLNNADLKIQTYNINILESVEVLVDPSVTTVTVRIRTTLTRYETQYNNTVTTSTAVTKTTSVTNLVNYTTTVYSTNPTSLTVTNTKTSTVFTINYTDPTVIATLIVAFLIGLGIAIAFRRI
jgi:hypothetical protein